MVRLDTKKINIIIIGVVTTSSAGTSTLTATYGGVSKSITIIVASACEYTIGQVIFNKTYTGQVESFIPACNGNYRIELWGAQGNSNVRGVAGATASYTKGEINLTPLNTLYIVIESKAGYNGGGSTNTSGYSSNIGGNGGGSSYISGHIGSIAITSETNTNEKSGCSVGTNDINCSLHYSNLKFVNTILIDGKGNEWTGSEGSQVAMPNPTGGNYSLGVGHSGHGYAKITYLGS